MDAYREEREGCLVPFGVVAAAVMNSQRSSALAHIWTHEDFFKPAIKEAEERTLDHVRDDFRIWHAFKGTN